MTLLFLFEINQFHHFIIKFNFNTNTPFVYRRETLVWLLGFERLRGTTGVERWGWTMGSGSFHSFLPMLPLASPTSSQRLREARYRQDNNRLIRVYIESRLELKRNKPETHVHTLTYTHGSTKRCGHTLGRCHYGARWHTSKEAYHWHSVHRRV